MQNYPTSACDIEFPPQGGTTNETLFVVPPLSGPEIQVATDYPFASRGRESLRYFGMSDKQNKVIVITGVTRGIGRALVPRFVALGQTVAGCGRSAESIAELSRTFAPPHTFSIVDVANDDQVQSWASKTQETIGPPDFLINNAGLMNRVAPLWQVPRAEFDSLIDVNVKGVANVIRHFVPAMVSRGSGVIVNVSSGWGRSSSPNVAPYVASKFAVEGLTKALAKELPAGMAAVAFNPGVIDTDMLRLCWGDEASDHEGPDVWAERAAPFLLGLGPQNSGQSVSLP
jgi:NAD(P)-dependent dehydrogenase (short-subunit alcohol dehydrogenase family)